MEKSIYVVIMAGGIGSRFWPYSRNDRPKQFIDVLGTGRSLLQMTYDRFLDLTDVDKIIVVTNKQYASLVSDQLPDISPSQILKEPSRKNTAPCIAYAAYKIKQKDPSALMVVTPADHAIFKENIFKSVLNNALKDAGKEKKLITIGIEPNRPETGYGYIQYLESETEVKKVKTFTEKPDLELAKTFLESGDFVWNAGIFVWSIEAIINSFEDCLSDIAEIFHNGSSAYYSDREEAFIERAYSLCRNISIDYGIMEKAPNVYVVLGDFAWSDLGSWNSLYEMRDKDDMENVVDGNVILDNCQNNYIKSEKEKLLVIQGLDGYLVADFDDVLLICEKDNEKKFREYVNRVKTDKGEKYL